MSYRLAFGHPGGFPGHTWLPTVAMMRAEILKLRRRRGLMIGCLGLTLVAAIVAYGLRAALHASDPAGYQPAGGVENLANGTYLLSELGAAAAMLIGVNAGAGDVEAGVFRNLVITGRPRLALFLARIPGGLAVLWPIFALAYLVSAAASVIFAGPLPAPSGVTILKDGLWLAVDTTVIYLFTLGIAALLGARTTTIGVLLPVLLVVPLLLAGVDKLNAVRQLDLTIALWQLAPSGIAPRMNFTMAHGTIAAVLALWVAAALAMGAWRTMTQDA